MMDLGDCKHGFTAAFCQACAIERLQEQVASLVRQAVAAEREACAKVADEAAKYARQASGLTSQDGAIAITYRHREDEAQSIAAAIRGRKDD